MRVGGTVYNTLKGGGTEKRGGETKISKRWVQTGSRGECLKKERGGGTPLWTMLIFFFTIFLNTFHDWLKCWLFYDFMFLVMLQCISVDDIQRKLKDLCQQIHDSLGKQKISDCFVGWNWIPNWIICFINYL